MIEYALYGSFLLFLVLGLWFIFRNFKVLEKTRDQRKLIIDIIYFHNMEELRHGTIPTDELWQLYGLTTWEEHERALRWGRDPIKLYSPRIGELWYKYHDESSTRSDD